MAKIRAATLTNYFEVADSLGLDADAMLARAGLTRAMLADPDHRIPGAAAGILLEESARESDCPAFGLLMAESRPISGLGAISLLLRHQRTLRDAIRVLIRYQHVLAEPLVISLDEEGGTAIIRCEIVGPNNRTRQPIELTIGELRRALTTIAGRAWHAESAHFVHDAPPDTAIHRRVLECPVQFGSDFNGLTCSTASLDVPIAGAEPEIARYAEDTVEMLMPTADQGGMAERTHRSLYLLLPLGRGTLDHAAASLGLHPRALQRQLVKEGSSFGEVLNAVRRELAVRHLASPAHSIEAIAVLVGYATLSSFSRWFAAEFGVPAGVWRAGRRPSAPA